MICMIPNVNLRDGELGFMFCDLHLSQNNPWWWGGGGYKFDRFALFDLALPLATY